MEEMLDNVAGARQIFEAGWTGSPTLRPGFRTPSLSSATMRSIVRVISMNRFVVCHPRPSFIKYAKFEAKRGEIDRARLVYECAIDLLSKDEEAEQLFVAFAGFEIWLKETERARCMYRYGLDHVPKGRAKDLYEYVAFEKQPMETSNTAVIEDAIVRKRKLKYDDEEVRKNPFNYDSPNMKLLEAAYKWKKQKLDEDRVKT